MAKLPRGGRRNHAEATAPSRVAASAGPKPPYQAATSTAKKTVAKGKWSPRNGSSSSRTTTAAATAAAATP